MNQDSLLRIRDLTKDEIMGILKDAQLFGVSHKDWQLPQRKLVANLFLSRAPVLIIPLPQLNISWAAWSRISAAQGSSVEKGESLYDTVRTFESIGYEALVIRHPKDEYFRELENIRIPIINAGDGAGNHPTQCLLDLLTIYQEFGTFEHIRMAIIGDISHSRVAASNKEAMELLGGECVFSGPAQWQREGYPHMDVDAAIEWADVVMMLRIQHERHATSMQMSKATICSSMD